MSAVTQFYVEYKGLLSWSLAMGELPNWKSLPSKQFSLALPLIVH